MKRFFVFFVFLFVVLLASSRPLYPIWGGSMTYTVSVNMTGLESSWQFLYTYDAFLNASRYDHGVNQTDEACALPQHHADQGVPCTVIHAYDGYLYIRFPEDGYCCKCTNNPDLGFVRPDWLERTNASYLGMTTIRGYEVDEWLVYAQYDNHYYDLVGSDYAKGVRFLEHKGKVPKMWDFDLSTWTDTISKESLAPPSDCSTRCRNDMYCVDV